MHVNPNLSYGAFKALTPEVPADVRPMVYASWVGNRTLEARRLMAHWGMDAQAVGRTVQSLSATLIRGRRKGNEPVFSPGQGHRSVG